MNFVGTRLMPCCKVILPFSIMPPANFAFQVLYTRFMVIAMAHPASHPTIIKMEYSMESVLAAPRLPRPHHSPDGPVPRHTSYDPRISPLAHSLHSENNCFRVDCVDCCRRLMVCGSRHDLRKRPHSYLQLLCLLCLCLQYTTLA